MNQFKQLILIILDGFGIASSSEGNSVVAANPVNLDYLVNHFPALSLQASGPAVGLPWGERGNSEVGHLNIGAGRLVSQVSPRISAAIQSGEFFKNESLLAAMRHVQKNHSRLHLVGLVSAGRVHSLEEHLYGLLALAASQQLREVFVHVFTDGRDTPPKEALLALDRLTKKFWEIGTGKVASLTGRFYAMDRGGHWEVTEATYRALVLGEGKKAFSARQAIMNYYQQQIYDETIPPTVIAEKEAPLARIGEGDAVIFFNLRADRMRQLVQAFVEPSFGKFSRKYSYLQNMYYVTLTSYEKGLSGAAVAFPPLLVKNSLAEVLSHHGLRQFHIAESEKYAHVTLFFNGGHEPPFPGEEREIVNSPAAYQKRYEDVPEMSVAIISEGIIEKLKRDTNFILANFANPDVVGHTGNKAACVAAIKAVDKSLGMIFQAVKERNGCLVISADHGNIEQVVDPRTGTIDKEHSLNPVPFIVAAKSFERKRPQEKGYVELSSLVPDGVLSDIAPTILELLGLPKAVEMTAVSLLPVLLKQVENLAEKNT